jgi:hypothetical protein
VSARWVEGPQLLASCSESRPHHFPRAGHRLQTCNCSGRGERRAGYVLDLDPGKDSRILMRSLVPRGNCADSTWSKQRPLPLATDCGLDTRRVGFRVPVESRDFTSPLRPGLPGA